MNTHAIKRIQRVLSAAALGLLAMPAAGKDTLQALEDEGVPTNVEELWSGFDPRAEPLDVEVLKEWEEEGVVMRVLRYRVGVFKGKKAMMAAVFGYPKDAKGVPGLVQIHGGGQYADHKAALANAKRGYATISVAWAGRISAPDYRVGPDEVKLFWDGKTEDPAYKITTDWGALDGYHAPSRNPKNVFPVIPEPAEWTLDAVKSPRNNGWFLCAMGARRALTFLEKQPQIDAGRLGVYGHSMGGKLTVLTAGADDRVKAAAPSCGGVSDRYNNDRVFRATLGDGPYLRRIACPVVFLSPSNDFHGRINDLQTALTEIAAKEWRVTCSAHHNHQDSAPFEVATQLWFDQHLKNAFRWPETPGTRLELKTDDGVPTFTVRPDSAMPIASVDVFYTQDADPESEHAVVKSRFWHHAPSEKHGDTWVAELPLPDSNRPLWAYANVTYTLEQPVTGAGYYYRVYTAREFNLSSPMAMVPAGGLKAAGVKATRRPSTMIEPFDGGWQKEWFTYRADEWPRRTHKVSDPLWSAPKGATLSLQVRSHEANQCVIGIDGYAAAVPLDGGEAWQTITLSPADFENARGEKLEGWEGIRELRLSGQETLRERRPDATRKLGKPWKGADPIFRDLKWVTREDAFSHPGISHGKGSIDFVRGKIAAGEEPWATAWKHPLEPLMPRIHDATSMWWAEGLPTVVRSAPWRRSIASMRYKVTLDTESLALSDFGELASDGSLHRDWSPVELVLTVRKDGKTYGCSRAKPWTRHTGPRLIESGRFFQRADVTDLVFQSDEGEVLKIGTRLETAAWPDRLSFILDAGPPSEGTEVEIALTAGGKTLRSQAAGTQVALAVDPMEFRKLDTTSPMVIKAGDRPVDYEPAIGWHCINLDGIVPDRADTNDAMERIPFTLANPSNEARIARLMFEKTRHGIRQRIGVPITGISAVLRDANGEPTGIPVQLSKNWHRKQDGGKYADQWFHGITQVRLPPGAEVALELVIVYGHWGGIPAASHAQLSLIGWGGNQLWEQSALGAWGESICYDPVRAQADCFITDVRPLMVTPMNGKATWNWTNNVGGGDFFRLFDDKGVRLPHGPASVDYTRSGPCLTEVVHHGRIGEAVRYSTTASLGRTDDIIRGTYRIRFDVEKAQPFSRFAIFQIGADTYNFTREPKFAFGNANGLVKEWSAIPGGDAYRTQPQEAAGDTPWISMHEATRRPGSKEGGAWANRGLVVREWSARLGGKSAPPFFAERGTTRHRSDYSTIDLVPPPGLSHLEPGDFIEATLEYLVIPQNAADYYGPNAALRTALQTEGNTWRMVHREAAGNRRGVTVGEGKLVHRFPDIRIRSDGDRAAFDVTGGLGYVPMTITGLSSHAGYTLTVDGKPVDQSVHGNDFWQTDFDPLRRRWSRTYNVPLPGEGQHRIALIRR